jgi:hypothetical protein
MAGEMLLAAASNTGLVWILVLFGLGALCFKAAADKGRNPWVWGIVGFLMPLLGLLFVLLLPRVRDDFRAVDSPDET